MLSSGYDTSVVQDFMKPVADWPIQIIGLIRVRSYVFTYTVIYLENNFNVYISSIQ